MEDAFLEIEREMLEKLIRSGATSRYTLAFLCACCLLPTYSASTCNNDSMTAAWH